MYYSESSTENGYRTLRIHNPNNLPSATTSLFSIWSLYGMLSDNNSFDDAFKNENKALFDELDSINQQLKNASDETKKDLNDKRLELQSSIGSKWQDKNIKINKQNIFKIVNSLSDLPQEYKYLENNFKNVNILPVSLF
ncbi:hypothetical protein CO229_02595 [Mycoplasmopsis bovirhinis]|uniref:hypothetical protein n=1 Tax=Mycoplasmopsis bovirhinis TaxID=29553 RepID=UPI000C05C17F|nr:hypothetical protein [Mycoplasmopsis bovirhinis]ATO30988.1 hypothetical protein CO229_02595 [Mycoplasmopsis bovirhinis]